MDPSVGRRSVLLLFLDGVGIGPDDADRNPFLRARLPTLTALLGGALPTLGRPRIDGPRATVLPLDATLGVEGLPQSGTGQIALLTGVNAARRFGRHFGPWPPVGLRDLLASENVLSKARASDAHVAFANAYPEGFPGDRATRRVAAPPLAALAASVLNRHAEALAAGEAISSEIINDGWRTHLGHVELPEIDPGTAGRNLARIAQAHDLTLYAHYSTDHAGHRGGMTGAIEALELVDAFLEGVLGAEPGLTTIVASDHGNVEDVTAQHTRNPALCLVHGPGCEDLSRRLSAITDVAPALLELLDAPPVD